MVEILSQYRRVTSYRKTLTLHRAVVDAIQAGNDDMSEAALPSVWAQTSQDMATQANVAMTGKANVRTQKRSQNWSK